jgi:hypothetical protein
MVDDKPEGKAIINDAVTDTKSTRLDSCESPIITRAPTRYLATSRTPAEGRFGEKILSSVYTASARLDAYRRNYEVYEKKTFRVSLAALPFSLFYYYLLGENQGGT